MTENKYIRSLDLYLIDSKVADFNKLLDVVKRLHGKKSLDEIIEFENFVNQLFAEEYLTGGQKKMLDALLFPTRNILQRELDHNAALLRR